MGGFDFPLVQILDAGGPVSFKNYFLHQRLLQNTQIGSFSSRVQISPGSGHTSTALNSQLIQTNTFLFGAIKVMVMGKPDLLSCMDKLTA